MGFFDSDVEKDLVYKTPEDFKSGLADILAEAKKIYEAKKQLGFQDYEGERIADFTPEEQAAMTGIASLVGEGKKYFDPATDLAKGLGDKFTTETAQEYMSPYQQAVTDVAKRKAREDFEATMQDIGLQSALGGGRRGTARAIVEAEGVQDLGQRLSDIQTLGSQSAFQDARRAFEAQKGRERQSGSALAALGQQAPQQTLKELTALSGVGEAQRDMTQQGLDLAYQNFLQKQQYPYDVLGRYQSALYNYPYTAYQTSSQGFSKPSSFQNLMGIIGAGKSLFPSFGFKEGGHIAFRSSGGLSGLNANYQEGTGDETVGSKGMKGLKDNLTANLLSSLNLAEMSSNLTKLQELRTKIAEAKAKKATEQDTFMNRLGTFAQGVAGSFDPTKPQSLAGSLAGGIKAVEEANLQDPELAKAQAEAEGLEGQIKTRQAMAELYKGLKGTGLKSPEVNTIMKQVATKYGAMFSENTGFVIDGQPVDDDTALLISNDILGALKAANNAEGNKFIAAQNYLVTPNSSNNNNNNDDKTLVGNLSPELKELIKKEFQKEFSNVATQ